MWNFFLECLIVLSKLNKCILQEMRFFIDLLVENICMINTNWRATLKGTLIIIINNNCKGIHKETLMYSFHHLGVYSAYEKCHLFILVILA